MNHLDHSRNPSQSRSSSTRLTQMNGMLDAVHASMHTLEQLQLRNVHVRLPQNPVRWTHVSRLNWDTNFTSDIECCLTFTPRGSLEWMDGRALELKQIRRRAELRQAGIAAVLKMLRA
jgi:hypothetical protein